MSHSGGYASTIPLSQRSLSAIRYFVWSRRSSQRLQKANVPKFWLITPSSCFDLANLKNGNLVGKFKFLIYLDEILPKWNVANIIILHVVRNLHIIMHRASTSWPKSFDSIKFIFFHSSGLSTSNDWNSFPGMNSYQWNIVIESKKRQTNFDIL